MEDKVSCQIHGSGYKIKKIHDHELMMKLKNLLLEKTGIKIKLV